MSQDANVPIPDNELHPLVLDCERSVFCLRTVDPRGGTVWEWWALDTRHPLQSRSGIARSAEAAQQAARDALMMFQPW